jgi:hypothetical protein
MVRFLAAIEAIAARQEQLVIRSTDQLSGIETRIETQMVQLNAAFADGSAETRALIDGILDAMRALSQDLGRLSQPSEAAGEVDPPDLAADVLRSLRFATAEMLAQLQRDATQGTPLDGENSAPENAA